MGIYDRDYSRDEPTGFTLAGDRSMVTNIALVTGGVYLLQLLTRSPDGTSWITSTFSLHSDLFRRPWQAYQLVTYGFLHEPYDLRHVVFNMIGLWFFGRDLENRFGRREFLGFYLSSIVIAGFGWLVAEQIASSGRLGILYGASGGVAAVVIAFAILFPKRTVLLFFVLPIPAWLLGVLFIAYDISGALNPPARTGNEPAVAYTAHLAGALCGLLLARTGWHLGKLVPAGRGGELFKRGPKLRTYDPDRVEREMSAEVDEILQKIQEQGQESLSARERKILEKASRRYQQKHR